MKCIKHSREFLKAPKSNLTKYTNNSLFLSWFWFIKFIETQHTTKSLSKEIKGNIHWTLLQLLTSFKEKKSFSLFIFCVKIEFLPLVISPSPFSAACGIICSLFCFCFFFWFHYANEYKMLIAVMKDNSLRGQLIGNLERNGKRKQ